jgi:hypothetical protein
LKLCKYLHLVFYKDRFRDIEILLAVIIGSGIVILAVPIEKLENKKLVTTIFFDSFVTMGVNQLIEGIDKRQIEGVEEHTPVDGEEVCNSLHLLKEVAQF